MRRQPAVQRNSRRAVQTPAPIKPRRNHFAQVSINGRAPVRMLVANVG